MQLKDFVQKDERSVFDLDIYEGDHPLPLLKSRALKEIPFIDHCFTTRAGGCSTGIYESLNLSYTRGDDPTAVTDNFQAVCRALHADISHVICSDQTHSVNVRYVDGSRIGDGLPARPFADTDGMITDVPGIVLAIFIADCVPLCFVDVRHRAIGVAHSGWRGTVQRMGQKTVEAMTERFHTNPEDLVCVIGPSICRDCYEVSQDVAGAFAEAFCGHEEEILTPKGHGKYLLDLAKSNEIVLTEAGVPGERIATTNICTCCNPELLFSHRASGGRRGNLGAFLTIR